MSASMQIALNETEVEEIRRLAEDLGHSPEDTAEEVVANGLLVLRRYAYLKKRSKTVDVSDALEILRHAGNEAPVPGDELPEGYIPIEQRRRA